MTTDQHRGNPAHEPDGRPRTSDGRQRTGRRGFLTAAGVLGATSLAGCTIRVSDGGITWDDGSGSDPTPEPTTTTGGTTTATGGGATTTEEEPVLVTAEPEPIDAEIVTVEPTPEPTTTATPTPDLGPTRFRVNNFRFKVISANDGDVWTDDEELFGSIWLEGYDSRSGYFEVVGGGLWGKADGVVYVIDRDEPLVVEEGKTAKLTVDEVVEFSNPEGLDRDISHISVGANLYEKDGADDTLGKYTPPERKKYKWRLSDAGTSTGGSMDFKDGGTHVRMSFDVTPLD